VSNPNLPLIILRRGPWQAELFDPRPAPALLGARFVHGGWIRRLLRDGRDLTGRAAPGWHAYDALGIPETFESGLGWHLVRDGEEFLRPGAGRLIRRGDEAGEEHADAQLSATLDWEIESGPDSAVFRTADTLRRPMRNRIGYQLERRVQLQDDGLVSTTTFTLHAGSQRFVPISWYAHPFFAQRSAQGTGFALPATAQLMPTHKGFAFFRSPGSAIRGDDGLWRLEGQGSRAVFAGLWGSREPSRVHLDGGGALELALDAPLDHIVLWASDVGASIEPKLSRTWVHGETASWSIAYRWLG
jgi:hypothetical protein